MILRRFYGSQETFTLSGFRRGVFLQGQISASHLRFSDGMDGRDGAERSLFEFLTLLPIFELQLASGLFCTRFSKEGSGCLCT
jgi:hypothetical protein